MIRRQVVMPVSPERLWDALTEPDQLAGWFGARVEWELRKEGAGPVPWRRRHRAGRSGRGGAAGPALAVPLVAGRGPDRGAGPRPRWRATRRPAARCPRSATCWSHWTSGTRLTIQERQVDSDRHPAPARGPASPPRLPPAGTAMAWTAWDGRLVGAWAGWPRRRRLRPFLGTRDRWRQPNPMSTPSSPPWRTPPGDGCSTSCPAEGPLTATELAASYPVSRQAVVKHLGALAAAGLLDMRAARP